MSPRSRSYRLTPEIIAANAAGQVLCLDRRAEGQTFRLHAGRPGPQLNSRITSNEIVAPPQETVAGPVVFRVDVCGPIGQRAEYHGDSGCGGGWTDGHDAIAERMIAALAEGDVVMVIDSPGGDYAGMREAIRRVQRVKAEQGRHVCVYADEHIGSAAYWWAAAVGDEIYIPSSGMVGSIGARACHESIAGALKAAGVQVEHFYWPGPGKIAWAPDQPLSDVGRERAVRDTTASGEAFAAAMEAARGISREEIIALDADSLSGEAAVAAGLADGVASLDEVFDYALARASGEETTMKRRAGESYEKTTKERYESDGDKPEEGEPTAEGEPEEEPAPEEEGDEEPEPEAEEEEPEPEAEAEDDKPMARAAAAPRLRSGASLAAIVGVREGASDLAIKSGALRMRQALDRLMNETDTSSVDEMVGAVLGALGDARRLAEVEEKNRQLVGQARAKERIDLLKKLAAADLPGYSRGELFVDVVDDRTGKRSIRPAPAYAAKTGMKLETLRGLVKSKLAGGARRASPYEPDRERAREDSRAPNLEAAKKNPVVLNAARRSHVDADTIARAHANLFPNEALANEPAI